MPRNAKKTAKNETKQKQNKNKMAKKIQREMNPENEKKIQRGMLTPLLPPPIKIGGGKGRCVVVQSV